MKVLERAKTPDGVDIQIEEWNEDYEFIPYASTVAAYPVSKTSISGAFSPKAGKRFRADLILITKKRLKQPLSSLKAAKKN